MARYESSIKQANVPCEAIYNRVSDLSGFEVLKQRILNDELDLSAFGDKSKIEQAKAVLKDAQFTCDSATINVPMAGKICFEIVEREDNRCVKYASLQSPISFKLWIQVLPVTDCSSKLRITIDADINPFMKMMVDKPLKRGIEQLAEMLTKIQ